MKHSHEHDTEFVLRSTNLKVTPLRTAILELMDHAHAPLSADDMAERLKKISFDRATLFRTLKTFSEAKILSPVDLGEGFLRYERNCDVHHHHHHIICNNCKEVETLPFCVPDEFLRYLKAKGYKELGHRLDFSGLCKKCA